jgi:hypothetical protein
MTIIRECTCLNDYQDKRYGKNKRVMNKSQGKDKNKAKCTVCGREHNV